MLLLITSIKLICEIALLSLLGRWVLRAWVSHLVPSGVGQNAFVWLFDTLCKPVVSAVAWLAPRSLPQQHHALTAFLALMLTWGLMTLSKIAVCLNAGASVCQ